MAKEQNPLDRVAQEMAGHCSLTEEEIQRALRGLFEKTRERAADAIANNEDDHETLLLAQQYLALAELIAQFGSALLAFDDFEDDTSPGPDDTMNN